MDELTITKITLKLQQLASEHKYVRVTSAEWTKWFGLPSTLMRQWPNDEAAPSTEVDLDLGSLGEETFFYDSEEDVITNYFEVEDFQEPPEKLI